MIVIRFTGGQEGTLWYYAALASVFARRMPGPLADELSATVTAMQDAAAKG